MKHFTLLTIIFFCLAVLRGQDETPPVAVCQDVTVYINDEGIAELNPEDFDGGSYDDESGIAFLELSEYELWCDHIWSENYITLYVYDNEGNESSCEARVTVLDDQPPFDLECTNLEIDLNYQGLAVIEAWELALGDNDNCGVDQIEASITEFYCEHIGDNVVTVTFYDASGNFASCESIVTVSDPTPAVAVCLYGGITVYLESGTASIGLLEINDGYEACRISSSVLSQSYFTCEDIGVIEVTLTVTDNEDNVTSCSTEVYVEDADGDLEAKCMNTIVQLVGGIATISFEDIDNGSVATCGFDYAISQTEFGVEDIGDVGITLTITDVSNNQSSCDALVTVLGGNTEDPVDCVVSAWSAWSDCSVACGGGTQIRTREVLVEPAFGGTACPVLEEQQSCNMDACCDNEWYVGEYTACDAECGGGVQTRVVECRDCEGNTLADGSCEGAKPFSTMACNEMFCVECDEAPDKPGKISGPKPRVCQGSTSVYSIDPVSGATSYAWSVTNGGQIIDGQGTTVVTVLFPAGPVTFVDLRVVAVNDCGESKEKKFGGIWSTNICGPQDPQYNKNNGNNNLVLKDGALIDDKAMFNIAVYPNPSSGLITVRLDHLKAGEQVAVRIMDMQGRELMHSGNFSGSKLQLDLGGLPQGLYLLEATSAESRKVIKIVKDK
jgi:hypothetical protein